MSLPGTNMLMIVWEVIIPNMGIKSSQRGNKLFPRWEKVRNELVRMVRTALSIVFSRV